jgi:cell division protein FtsQ
VAKNNYPTRTTLWDTDPAEDLAAPPPTTRGTWRAPSAALTDRSSRRVLTPTPLASDRDSDREDGVPRRTKFVVSRTPWYRPRTSFGRILLATAAFIVLASLTAAILIARAYLIRDPHFRINTAANVEASGLSEIKRAELLPVFGEDIGRNIFSVPLSARRKQLESIPWVQQATVMRYLPDRLSVSIVERTPVAFVRQGDQVELADADGVILSMPPAMMAQHHYSFPVLTGIDARDSLTSRRARMAVYQRFLSELDQTHQHFSTQVSEIDLSDPEDLRATMPEQGSDILVHFGEDHFLDRLQTYKSHIAAWRQLSPKLIGVDLRYTDNVPLETATDTPGDTTKKFPSLVAPPVTHNAAPVSEHATVAAKPSAAFAAIPTPSAPTSPSSKPTTATTTAARSHITPVHTGPTPAQVKAAKLKAAHARQVKDKAARDKAAHQKAATHNVSHPKPAATNH